MGKERRDSKEVAGAWTSCSRELNKERRSLSLLLFLKISNDSIGQVYSWVTKKSWENHAKSAKQVNFVTESLWIFEMSSSVILLFSYPNTSLLHFQQIQIYTCKQSVPGGWHTRHSLHREPLGLDLHIHWCLLKESEKGADRIMMKSKVRKQRWSSVKLE